MAMIQKSKMKLKKVTTISSDMNDSFVVSIIEI